MLVPRCVIIIEATVQTSKSVVAQTYPAVEAASGIRGGESWCGLRLSV